MDAQAIPTTRPAWPGVLLELTKFRISAVSTVSAATGYAAFRHGLDRGLASLLVGTLLMAMAASALNEAQEWRLDARMERTRLRPIPRGAVPPAAAAGFALALGTGGFLLLLAAHGWPTALLGLLAMAWYNGLYTPLKRVSAFAVVPGSVIGAVPPAMGWAAAGGRLGDPAVLALCFFFFIWQVPHFWLLALLHRKSYEEARLPTLHWHFSEQQILRLIFTWTCATAAACALLPAYGVTRGPGAMVLLGIACLWLIVRFADLLRSGPRPRPLRRAFMDINGYLLFVMLVVVLGATLWS
jgi:protoheme IX farnesyltransferase